MNQLKQIKDFPSYFVSDCGDVFSNSGNLIKNKQIKKTGYETVDLYCHSKRYTKLVHRLVAEAFIPNPDNKCDVNHINGIKTDNRVENLEWATRSENVQHSFRILGRKATWLGKFGKNNPHSKIILQIKNNKIIAEFYGTNEAKRNTGINPSNICACCQGKRNFAGGYQWKYKPSNNKKDI